jgi:hypothetical protein
MLARCKFLTLAWLLVCAVSTHVSAHEGHAHDVIAVPGHYEPRFDGHTDAVELTGILNGSELWLYVAHYPENSPWSGLKVALESDGRSVPAQAIDTGVYRVAATDLARTGKHSVVVSLAGAGLDDLLNGELVVAESAQPRAPVTRWLVAGVAALLLGIVGAVALRQRHSGKTQSR